ncbi:MAG: hypothetical protein WC722_03075 [Rhodospirillales bacterium]|jgi:hypothetical protein
MTDCFRISFEPLSREHGSEIERATLATVKFTVEDQVATRLYDELARTVRDSSRVSILRLATWFAENWWRLRWEPETLAASSSWRMCHSMAAAGGGYLWPRMTFSSEGDYMRIRSWPTPGRSKEHIRYLEDIDALIPIAAFENSVDGFIDGVLSRIAGLGLDAEELKRTWEIAREERADPNEANLRKLEALLGYDSEEAPETLLNALHHSESEFGTESVGEVAAAKGSDSIAVLEAFRSRLRHPGNLVSVPESVQLKDYLRTLPTTDRPWQRAEKLAAQARNIWSVGAGPVKGDRLFELLGSKHVLDAGDLPFAAGIRPSDSPEKLAISCRSRNLVGRRFELARLLADQIAASPADRLLPATPAKTGRQKFQRAFASEFLCPYHEIVEEFGNKLPDDDEIESVAAKYEVSSLLVKTGLVNKGVLPRNVLPV